MWWCGCREKAVKFLKRQWKSPAGHCFSRGTMSLVSWAALIFLRNLRCPTRVVWMLGANALRSLAAPREVNNGGGCPAASARLGLGTKRKRDAAYPRQHFCPFGVRPGSLSPITRLAEIMVQSNRLLASHGSRHQDCSALVQSGARMKS